MFQDDLPYALTRVVERPYDPMWPMPLWALSWRGARFWGDASTCTMEGLSRDYGMSQTAYLHKDRLEAWSKETWVRRCLMELDRMWARGGTPIKPRGPHEIHTILDPVAYLAALDAWEAAQ